MYLLVKSHTLFIYCVYKILVAESFHGFPGKKRERMKTPLGRKNMLRGHLNNFISFVFNFHPNDGGKFSFFTACCPSLRWVALYVFNTLVNIWNLACSASETLAYGSIRTFFKKYYSSCWKPALHSCISYSSMAPSFEEMNYQLMWLSWVYKRYYSNLFGGCGGRDSLYSFNRVASTLESVERAEFGDIFRSACSLGRWHPLDHSNNNFGCDKDLGIYADSDRPHRDLFEIRLC